MTENKQYILIPFEEGNLIFKDDGREFFNSVDCLKDNEIVDLLNKQDEYINLLREELELADKQNTELEKENASMKDKIINAMINSNQVECNCTTCVCEDYVNEELKKW